MSIIAELRELNKALDDLSSTMKDVGEVNKQTAQTLELTSLVLMETNLKRQAEQSEESARTTGFLGSFLLCISGASAVFVQVNVDAAFLFVVLFLVPSICFLVAYVMIKEKTRRILREARRVRDRRAVLEVLRG